MALSDNSCGAHSPSSESFPWLLGSIQYMIDPPPLRQQAAVAFDRSLHRILLAILHLWTSSSLIHGLCLLDWSCHLWTAETTFGRCELLQHDRRMPLNSVDAIPIHFSFQRYIQKGNSKTLRKDSRASVEKLLHVSTLKSNRRDFKSLAFFLEFSFAN